MTRPFDWPHAQVVWSEENEPVSYSTGYMTVTHDDGVPREPRDEEQSRGPEIESPRQLWDWPNAPVIWSEENDSASYTGYMTVNHDDGVPRELRDEEQSRGPEEE